MSWSLNETAALAKKAARGAGMSWGMAEEAAFAVRWLASFGLPGPQALAGLLEQIDGVDAQDLRVAAISAKLISPSGRMCPLTSGVTICDHAHTLVDADEITIYGVIQPLLIVPFVAQMARQNGHCANVSWGEVAVTVDGNGCCVDRDDAALLTAQATQVRIQKVSTMDGSRPRVFRAQMEHAFTRVLLGYAHRTYAPGTEESRLKGAGAGASDND
jgi:hypothetical protein